VAVAALTLWEAYERFRLDPPQAIPFWVWLLENPDSPLRFPGQVSLQHHDFLHLILGLGVDREAEAEVVGWSIGNDPSLQVWQVCVFLWVAMTLYPEPYRFRWQDLPFFFHGLWQGRQVPRVSWDSLDPDQPLVDVRREVLGIKG